MTVGGGGEPRAALGETRARIMLFSCPEAARWRQRCISMSGVTNGRFVDRAKNISYEVIIRKFYISIIILRGPSAQLILIKKLQLAKVRTWPGGENAVLTVGTTLTKFTIAVCSRGRTGGS